MPSADAGHSVARPGVPRPGPGCTTAGKRPLWDFAKLEFSPAGLGISTQKYARLFIPLWYQRGASELELNDRGR